MEWKFEIKYVLNTRAYTRKRKWHIKKVLRSAYVQFDFLKMSLGRLDQSILTSGVRN